jgi:hypothetical protein
MFMPPGPSIPNLSALAMQPRDRFIGHTFFLLNTSSHDMSFLRHGDQATRPFHFQTTRLCKTLHIKSVSSALKIAMQSYLGGRQR